MCPIFFWKKTVIGLHWFIKSFFKHATQSYKKLFTTNTKIFTYLYMNYRQTNKKFTV